MKNKTCPACGGKNIVLQHIEQIINEPFGEQKIISLKEYHCSDCGTKGDFFDENDDSIYNALTELKSNAVLKILEEFIQKKISLASIERALELPQRTLAKWKNKNANPSSTGVALFKFLKLFPWLLDVAENKYNEEIAKKIYLKASLHDILNQYNYTNYKSMQVDIAATDNSTLHFDNYKKSGNNNEDNNIKTETNNAIFLCS